jgi:hypothetical protein
LSVTVTAAAKEPLAAGVKVTLMAQLAPAATLDPQLLLCAKSLGLAPVSAMLVMLRDAVPVFFRVAVWAVLVAPTDWLPKARLVADRLKVGCSPTPVPDNDISREPCVPQPITIMPVTLPLAVGAKVTSKAML